MAHLITHAEAKAQAKRERKAAKRRRDAELTRLGMEVGRARVVAETLWLTACLGGELGEAFHMADVREDDCRMTMQQLRRGEVVP